MHSESTPLTEGRSISSGVAPEASIPKPNVVICGQSVAHRNTSLDEYDNFVHDKYGYCYYSMEPKKLPMIYNLYVEPRYRRQGHAKRLIQQVKAVICSAGHLGPILVEARPSEPGINLGGLVRLYVLQGLSIINTKQEA